MTTANYQIGSVDGNVIIKVEMASLRDQFAMAALTGMLADPGRDYTFEKAAGDAYGFADAMLKERAEGEVK